MCLLGLDQRVPCSFYLPFLGCLVSEPSHHAGKEPQLAHGERPHGEVTCTVPTDSAAGVQMDSQHQLPIM